jgi:uncharacterized protein (TIGR02284 family)
MPEAQRETIKILKDLIATCRDAEEGLGKAAKGTHDDVLRDTLTAWAGRHDSFARELEEEVRRLGAEPPESGHLSGIQHRGWRELEESIRPKEDSTFVLECLRGEDGTIKHYEHALSRNLPARIRRRLEAHLSEVQRATEELGGSVWVRRAG